MGEHNRLVAEYNAVVIDLAAKALDASSQERERDVDWIVKRKRAHDRDSGRDR